MTDPRDDGETPLGNPVPPVLVLGQRDSNVDANEEDEVQHAPRGTEGMKPRARRRRGGRGSPSGGPPRPRAGGPAGPPSVNDEEKDFVGEPDSPRQLLLGFVFGLIFGFLLQKGGVAKYEVLLGQFLLTDFTVMKVMGSAVVVGMAGVFGLHALGKVKLHVKPTRYASNIAGGLVFGVGMALLGYCPGTGAAALGAGGLDALFGIAGLMAGSYLYAEASDRISATIHGIGNRGRIMLPDLLRARRGPFLAVFLPLLVAGLVVLHFATR